MLKPPMLYEYFQRGGPIMWPLLVTSIVAMTVVIERAFFLARAAARRRPAEVERLFAQLENGDADAALRSSEGSPDYVVRAMRAGLAHGRESLSNALLRSCALALRPFNRGLSVLDTIITLAPLLGLLGTVTGMIRAFGVVRGELDAPTAITGGIAEALIATAFGLGIAIISLLPFNYLNARLEEARHDLQDAATRLEMHSNTQR